MLKRIQINSECHALNIADESTVAGAPVFLFAVFFMVSMIGVLIG